MKTGTIIELIIILLAVTALIIYFWKRIPRPSFNWIRWRNTRTGTRQQQSNQRVQWWKTFFTGVLKWIVVLLVVILLLPMVWKIAKAIPHWVAAPFHSGLPKPQKLCPDPAAGIPTLAYGTRVFLVKGTTYKLFITSDFYLTPKDAQTEKFEYAKLGQKDIHWSCTVVRHRGTVPKYVFGKDYQYDGSLNCWVTIVPNETGDVFITPTKVVL